MKRLNSESGKSGESIIRTARGYIGRGNLNYTDDIDSYRHVDGRMSAWPSKAYGYGVSI